MWFQNRRARWRKQQQNVVNPIRQASEHALPLSEGGCGNSCYRVRAGETPLDSSCNNNGNITAPQWQCFSKSLP